MCQEEQDAPPARSEAAIAAPEVVLQRFQREDIPELLSWVDGPHLLARWAANSLTWPLDTAQIERLVAQSELPDAALHVWRPTVWRSGEPSRAGIGHIELLVDAQNRAGRLARVLIGPEWARGQGYGAKMVEAALRIAFDTLDLHRVSLAVFDFNASAIACYRRAGFREEGLHRDAYRIGESYWSAWTMAVLRDEWLSRGTA